MSTATMSGSDAVKATQTTNAAGSKQLKSSGSGKSLDGARKQTASPVDGQNRKQQTSQPKAWQGPNPITQRASAALPNGTDKPLPKPPSSQPQAKNTTDSNADKHAHDRALYLIASFTGHDATLTLKNGEQFTGIFSGASFESSKQQYILKMVKRIRLPTQQQVNGTTEPPNEYFGEGEDHMMAFDSIDTVELFVPDVAPVTAQPVQNGSINSSFRTDTEISGRDPSMPRERELQRWEPGADSTIDMSLEDSGESGWDQFAINERMYGVQSTYDENIYTTQIDRSDPQYRRREAEAARIAREIEGSAPANAHVAEERRRDADRGDGLDEEEKYSGVKREASALPKRAAGAYVPPYQRPLTNAPTVPGAPFDPAILSLERPAQQAVSPAKTAEQAPAVEPSTTINEQPTPTPESAANTTRSPPQLIQPPQTHPTGNTAEDHVRNLTRDFKGFANNEKLRLRMAKDQMVQEKRSLQRQEKNVKLNDLKKFAENFKLPTRVPDDLVPILAKDREKQIEIQVKAEKLAKEKEEEKIAIAKEKAEKIPVGAASPAPSSSAASQVDPRTPFRARLPGNGRGQALPGQMLSPRQPPAGQSGGQQNRAYGHQIPFPPRPLPLPADMRIPPGPSSAIPPTVAPADAGPLSPTSATRLNVNAKAFEFRPAASAFTPTGASPSPQRSLGSSDQAPAAASASAVPEIAEFFSKDKKEAVDSEDKKDIDDSSFSCVDRVLEELTEEQKSQYASTGGIPQPFRTPPTWPLDEKKDYTSYTESIPKSREPSLTPSRQMHTPTHSSHAASQMPHAHQLPPHMQGLPHVTTPIHQRQPYPLPPPPQHRLAHQHPQAFGPGMQQYGGSSVQSSPRFQPPQMAFGAQMQGMVMPQFGGQMPQQYGMSPSLQYSQPHMAPTGMAHTGPGGMMMMPGQGQMSGMPPSYPRGPPNQFNPNIMGGVPMTNQASSGPYMSGPAVMQQPHQQAYSPMPHHATPHMPHAHMQQHHHHHAGGYGSAPRPQMMQQTASHQGFQPPMHMGQGGPAAFSSSPAGSFAVAGHHQHPYALQHRQMSHGSGIGVGGYPHMTPRQQQVMPVQGSPGMGVGAPGLGMGQGDEGK